MISLRSIGITLTCVDEVVSDFVRADRDGNPVLNGSPFTFLIHRYTGRRYVLADEQPGGSVGLIYLVELPQEEAR